MPMNVNTCILAGNLTAAPECRYTTNTTAVANLRLAVNGKGKDNADIVTFVDVTVWGKSAEACSNYLRKGSPVLIEGELRLQEWEARDGQKRSKHVIVARRVHFVPSSESRSDDRPSERTDDPGPAARDREEATTDAAEDDDNLPF